MNKMSEKLLGSKWSADDKEQLKKFILIYGYGRWKQIQEASKQMGGKLKEKPLSELRGFANAFIRCISKRIIIQNEANIMWIVEDLTVEKDELRKFLLSILEEYPEDPYILTNASKIKSMGVKLSIME